MQRKELERLIVNAILVLIALGAVTYILLNIHA